MADWVRLFGRIHLLGTATRRIEQIRLRIHTTNPPGAVVRITDTQVQSGHLITGWVPGPDAYGLAANPGWTFRNGIFRGDQTVVVAADTAQASPARVDVEPLTGATPISVGDYHFGDVTGPARTDGLAATATTGAGTPPHITARADIDLPITQPAASRTRALIWFRGLHPVPDATIALPSLPAEPLPDVGAEPAVPLEPTPDDPGDGTPPTP